MRIFLCSLMTLGLSTLAHAEETKTAQVEPNPAAAQKVAEPSKEAPPVHQAPERPETTLDNQKNETMKPETEKALEPIGKDADAGKKKRKKK